MDLRENLRQSQTNSVFSPNGKKLIKILDSLGLIFPFSELIGLIVNLNQSTFGDFSNTVIIVNLIYIKIIIINVNWSVNLESENLSYSTFRFFAVGLLRALNMLK